jgi:hypothetical protein
LVKIRQFQCFTLRPALKPIAQHFSVVLSIYDSFGKVKSPYFWSNLAEGCSP